MTKETKTAEKIMDGLTIPPKKTRGCVWMREYPSGIRIEGREISMGDIVTREDLVPILLTIPGFEPVE